MNAQTDPPDPIGEYIARQPPQVQPMLNEMRAAIGVAIGATIGAAIGAAAPQAQETISYGMPGYKLNGYLVGFAAAKRHIGFYPTPSAIAAFQAELADYARSKGAVQFPLDRPLPIDLIQRMVRFRVDENTRK